MAPITLFGHTLGRGPVEAFHDNAFGSIDESVGRQFDGVEGGGMGDQIQDFFIMTDDPSKDDFQVRGFGKTAVDTAWSYEGVLPGQVEGDTVDVPGAAVWGTSTSFVEDPEAAVSRTLGDTLTFGLGEWDWSVMNNKQQGNSVGKGRLILIALIGMVALYLLAPVLNLISSILGATSS